MSMPPSTPITHGTWAGYNLGCREDCCREAARLYQKRRVYDLKRGLSRKVDCTGLRRRIQALNDLGWSNYAIAARAGVGREQIRQWCMRPRVYRTSYEKVSKVYDELSMTLPPERTRFERMDVTRTRNRARRLGFAPPLAWDNIDDPNERPKFGNRQKSRDEVDEAVVERFLSGEYDLRTNIAERREIARRWAAAGRSLAELERLTGWKPERYHKIGDAA